MVYLDQLEGRHSDRIERRVASCVVKQVGPAEYEVSFPDQPDKEIRIVRLGLLGERGIASCSCIANKRERPCCHCVASFREFKRGIPKAA